MAPVQQPFQWPMRVFGRHPYLSVHKTSHALNVSILVLPKKSLKPLRVRKASLSQPSSTCPVYLEATPLRKKRGLTTFQFQWNLGY